MKNRLLFLIYLCIVGQVSAQERGHYDLVSVNEVIQETDFSVAITSWERQKIEIMVEKPAGMPVEIKMRTDDRLVICSDRANRSALSYRRVLNLTQLEPGRYRLEIEVGKKLIRRELRLESVEQSYRSLTLH